MRATRRIRRQGITRASSPAALSVVLTMGYPERTPSMPWRQVSGRPRHVQVLILSLIVLTVGVATAYGRTGSPQKLQTAAYAGADQFDDVPPPALAADPPGTAPTP